MISVIMPAYNVEAYIRRSIQSLQAQTYTNWELLIVDDGSTDQTRSVVKEIAGKDQRVKLLCNQHGGTARARNTALERVQGEYITFIDSDDAYHPAYLQTLLEAIHKNKVDMAICGIHIGTNYDEFLKTPLQEEAVCIDMDTAFARMYDQEWPLMISPCNKLYKAELFKNVRFPVGQYFEDASTTNLVIFQCSHIAVLDAKMYFYHITPGSSSKTKRSVELLDRERALRSHWEFFFQNGRKDLAYQAIPFYLHELLYIDFNIRRSDRPEDCKIIRDKFVRTYRKYWRKVKTSDERAQKIFEFRYPRLGVIRNRIRCDGVIKTVTRFIKKRLGLKK